MIITSAGIRDYGLSSRIRNTHKMSLKIYQEMSSVNLANDRIRMINMHTIVGNGDDGLILSGGLSHPHGIAGDVSEIFYITDIGSKKIRLVT